MIDSFIIPSFSLELLFSVAKFFSENFGTCLLFSGGSGECAKHSFLGLFPIESVTGSRNELQIKQGKNTRSEIVDNLWNGLEDFFFTNLSSQPDSMAFGWFGYEMGGTADKDYFIETVPASTPDAYWQRCAIVLKFDHETFDVLIFVEKCLPNSMDPKSLYWIARLGNKEGWLSFLNTLKFPAVDSVSVCKGFVELNGSDQEKKRSLYVQKVQQAKELISQGEIYQVNISHPFNFQVNCSPFELFRKLIEENPAPFSAYFYTEKAVIISISPERFLFKQGRSLETRPIKGTIRRTGNPEEDLILKKTLLESLKERAELLMITDLMRNDLAQVSEEGSVETIDLWRCEAHTYLFHLISVIRSISKKTLKPLEIIRSCFPGGSITGCPKLRAMEVIHHLENRSRGIYTGSIGYFTGKGDCDLNIAIRTLVLQNGEGVLQVGSGVVYDSNPDDEYLETLVKGNSFFRFFKDF